MSDALAYLFRLEQFGIKFGLDNIRTLLARLDHPERAFQSVHVAGTNGKGSVTAMVDAALRAAGHRSGRYTSPHLVSLAERFVIDGAAIDMSSLADTARCVRDAIEALRASGELDVPPTFFEATTAVAFELFRRAHVEIAVVEVGLGGRLDSTNVIDPLVSAITSIDLDHQQYLGATIAEIAFEKAGIIKTGVPVVVDQGSGEAFDVVARVATERGAELIRAWDGVSVRPSSRIPTSWSSPAPIVLSTPIRDYGEVRLGLRGAHQVANAVVAVRVLETLTDRGVDVPPEAIIDGLANVSWPGRLERRAFSEGRELLLDAAHNPAGAAALASYLRESGSEKPPLVFSAMRDKDLRGMLTALAPAIASLIVTRASNARAARPDAVAELARRLAPDLPVLIVDSVREALDEAWSRSPRIVVAGSIFLLGDVMKSIDA